MLFMCIETYKNQDAKTVYRRFRDKGRQMPDGLTFVGSWVTADLDLTVGRAWYLLLSWSRERGGFESNDQVYGGVSYRF